MPTFSFRHRYGLGIVWSTAASLNAARDKLASARPDKLFHDDAEWQAWECWIGGKCVWYVDADTGELVQGPKPATGE